MMTWAASEIPPAPPLWLFGSEGLDVPALDRSSGWRHPKGIVVDLDDTLYPLSRFVQSGFAAVAAYCETTFDIPADRGYLLLNRCASIGQQKTAFQALCRKYGLSLDTLPVLLEVYRAHRPSISLGEGALDMLRTLRADQWRIVIATNGIPAVQARKVEALGLTALVDHVIYADDVAPGGKPAPAVFVEALRRLGTRADRTVCVGDDLRRDILGARTAGLSTIRIASRHVVAAPGVEADRVVEALNEVPRAAASLLEGVSRHAA